MAVLTFYLTGQTGDGSSGNPYHGITSQTTTGSTANATGNFTVARIAANRAAQFGTGLTRPSTAFQSGQGYPSPAVIQEGTSYGWNYISLSITEAGTFADGPWTVYARAWGSTIKSQAGICSISVHRYSGGVHTPLGTADGSTITISTTAQLQTLTTATGFYGAPISVAAGDEIRVSFSWFITTAGGSNSCDVILTPGDFGSNTVAVVSPTFTPAGGAVSEDQHVVESVAVALKGGAATGDAAGATDSATSTVDSPALGTAYNEAVNEGMSAAEATAPALRMEVGVAEETHAADSVTPRSVLAELVVAALLAACSADSTLSGAGNIYSEAVAEPTWAAEAAMPTQRGAARVIEGAWATDSASGDVVQGTAWTGTAAESAGVTDTADGYRSSRTSTSIPLVWERGDSPQVGTASTAAVTLPTLSLNDVVIAVGSGNGSGGTTTISVSDPTAWTQFFSQDGTNNRPVTGWYRRATADANDPTSVTITNNGGTWGVACEVLIYRGCRTSGSPFNAVGTAVYANATSVTAPSITTTVNGCQILLLGSNGGGTYRPATPSSGIPVVEQTSGSMRIAFDSPQASAGATGASTFAWSDSGSHTGNAVLVALEPAPSGTTQTGSVGEAVGATDSASTAQRGTVGVAEDSHAADALTVAHAGAVAVSEDLHAADALALSRAGAEALSEETHAADALVPTQRGTTGVAEALAARDSAAGNVSGAAYSYSEQVAEAAGATDALVHAARGAANVVEDSHATDSVQPARGTTGAVVEDSHATDGLALSRVGAGVVVEETHAADAVAPAQRGTVGVAESAHATDTSQANLSGAAWTYNEGISDSAAARESASATQRGTVAVGEGAGATDSAQAALACRASVAEDSHATDSTSVALRAGQAVDEAAGAQDELLGYLSGAGAVWPAAQAEAAGARDGCDSALLVGPRLYTGQVAEAVGATDSATPGVACADSLLEVAGAQDSQAPGLAAPVSVAEVAQAADGAAVQAALAEVVSEAVAALESCSGPSSLLGSVTLKPLNETLRGGLHAAVRASIRAAVLRVWRPK